MKKALIIFSILLVGAVGFILYYFYNDTKDPYVQACDYTVPESEIPTFTELATPFTHHFDDTRSLPMLAAVLIDMDGDGVDEIFAGGGNDQPDGFLKYTNGSLVDLASTVLPQSGKGEYPSLGAVAADLDNDGKTDLIVCRTNGVFFYKNEGETFSSRKLDIVFNEKSTPLSLTLGDINKDGYLDMYVAAYIKVELMKGQTIFTDRTYGATSLLLLNNGDLTFKDVTVAYGLDYIHNTFQGILADVNEDGWLDLIVAHDTGEVRTYRNKEGQSFEMMSNPTTGKFSYPMGIAAGDYNNDGTIDFFFSNTGSSIPEFIARGDLKDDQIFIKEWMLFQYVKGKGFMDVARPAKLANFEFSWGAIFEDFNLDGLQDLAVAENYIAFPPQQAFKLPCRLLVQRENGTFAAVEEQAKAENRNFAITPLSTDLNQDGYPDLIYSNLDGPMKVFLSNGGTSNYVKVSMTKNATSLGAKVEVQAGGKIYTQHLLSGEGLCSDQGQTLIFGLGQQAEIERLVIYYPSGKVDSVQDATINKRYFID